MQVLKSLVIAFSMYSRIPVPQFVWKEEDRKYVLCFFPWIGAVIGLCLYLWGAVCKKFGIGEWCYVMIGTLIPLMITGGFHVDGYMDTMDAIHSYGSREKKLEILKDSHIGAFAVIMLAAYGLLYMGTFSEIREDALFRIVCSGFFLSRCLSGIAALSFPPAKREGMLYESVENSGRPVVKAVLYLQSLLCICLMLLWSLWGAVIIAAALWTFVCYYYRTKKEFGGITGDTAGFFVLVCEVGMMAAASIINIFAGR